MKKVLLVFILAFVVRLFLIPIAHHGDLNNNISWGQELIARGFDGYYGSSDANFWPYSAPNQPPLYILLFGFLVFLFNFIKSGIWWLNSSIGVFPSGIVWFWNNRGMDFLVKLPAILSDIGIGWLIYKYFHKRNNSKSILIASIWLFNPISWYNSAIWGQTDAIVNFIGIIAILGILGEFNIAKRIGNLVWFAVWFTVSILFKASLTIFISVLVVVILKQKHKLKEYVLAVCYAVVTIFIISIWFYPHLGFPVWFVNLYKDRILPGEIGYLTANAFNYWWIIDSGKTLDSSLFLGITARTWGIVLEVFGIVIVLFTFIKNKMSDKRVFLALASVALITFLFMTRMHERYLYPFFPYLNLVLFTIPNLGFVYLVLSVTYLLNMYNLFWAPNIPFLVNFLGVGSFTVVLSLLNIFSLYFVLRQLRKVKL